MIKIIIDKKELEGTNYVEVFPGKNTKESWSDKSVFFTEDSFSYIEDIFESVNSFYDHFSFTEYSEKQKNEVIKILEARLHILNSGGSYLIKSSIFNEDYRSELQKKFESNKKEIVNMIQAFYDWLLEVKSLEITIMGL